MAAMDVEVLVGLAVGAVQPAGMEQRDELGVAGVLVHEAGPAHLIPGISA